MRHRSIPTADLLLDTSLMLARLLPVWGAIALVKFAAVRLMGASGAPFAVPLLFGAFFFAAPLAVSRLRSRRRITLASKASARALLFCFVWGALVVSAFVATLQVWQGMAATPFNYLVAALVGGSFCLVTATIPGRW
jgi:hypothetical protein